MTLSNPNKYLEIWKLAKAFPSPDGGDDHVVVKDFDLHMREGEFLSLIGHSGCGKSTVLSIVAGLATKTYGSIILADKEVKGAGPDRGVVFQAPCLLPWMTALDNVMLGVDQVFPSATRAQRRHVAQHYLSLVGLADSMGKMPGELSQGMRQRVGIARAFALSPKMLLLDEPFGMLDSLTRMELQEVLLSVWREKRITALMVTHDVDEALFLSDRVAMMTSGPEAKIGDILHIPFDRPRNRQAVLEHPDYYRLREHLIGFLEGQDHRRKPANQTEEPQPALEPASSPLEAALTPTEHRMTRIVRVNSAIALLTLAVVSATSLAQGTPGTPTKGAATPQAPAYTPVRWNEDYSYLKNAPDADFFDRIKYIPLGVDDWYLSLGGQLRYRYEYFNNFNFSPLPPAPPQDETGYHLTRILLHGDVHFGKNIRFFAQGKSAMEDGREGGPRPVDADEIDVQQFFVDFKIPFGEKTGATVRLGRQDLLYGAQRFISPLDWTNTRRTFEGGKVSTTLSPTLSVDGFWVHPVDVEKESLNWADKDTNFYGLYATLGLPNVLEGGGTKLEIYGLALNRNNALFAPNAATAGGDEDRYTLGARFSSAPKPWDFDLELDYQFGKFEGLDIFAWSVAAEAGYTFAKIPTSPRLYLGFDYASGDDDPDDDEFNTFNQLFPLAHAYFGYIDVIGRQNIIDLHPGVELTAIQNARYVKKLTFRADYHLFWRASDDDAVYNVASGGGSAPPSAGVLRGDSGSDETFVGSELDFLLTWQVDRHLQIYGGYSHFFTGDFIDDTGPSKDIDFLYMAVIFTF